MDSTASSLGPGFLWGKDLGRGALERMACRKLREKQRLLEDFEIKEGTLLTPPLLAPKTSSWCSTKNPQVLNPWVSTCLIGPPPLGGEILIICHTPNIACSLTLHLPSQDGASTLCFHYIILRDRVNPLSDHLAWL